MVPGAAELEVAGEDSRVAGSLQQAHEDARASWVGHRTSQSVHHIETIRNGQYRMIHTTSAELNEAAECKQNRPILALSVSGSLWEDVSANLLTESRTKVKWP